MVGQESVEQDRLSESSVIVPVVAASPQTVVDGVRGEPPALQRVIDAFTGQGVTETAGVSHQVDRRIGNGDPIATVGKLVSRQRREWFRAALKALPRNVGQELMAKILGFAQTVKPYVPVVVFGKDPAIALRDNTQ